MAETEHLEVGSGGVNPLAVVSVVAALLAVAGMFGLGTGAAAAFAVGAGHVSLHQIHRRQDRGRSIALVGLVIGYGVATWGFLLALQYIPSLAAAIF